MKTEGLQSLQLLDICTDDANKISVHNFEKGENPLSWSEYASVSGERMLAAGTRRSCQSESSEQS